ncbi:glycosyltransferase [Prosthecobacter sp.]|uniref:glycosyltransferase n=1 Tax=Prosthecobacter sp. TaxID=1965333 RepID=UPI002489C2B2|nr:glycosyltransferase [Prosthecobacter sp.]MDI1314118.1 glycosyltransferase [Prosthecobacter sp.]
MISSPVADSVALRVLWLRVGGCQVQHNGGAIYAYHLMTHLMKHCHLHVLESHKPGDEGCDEAVSYAHERECVFSQLMEEWAPRRFFSFIWPIVHNLFASREPFSLTLFHSEKFAQRARELEQSGRFDLIIADGLYVAPVLASWTAPRKTPVLLLQQNVEALIWKRLSELQRNPFVRLFFCEMARRMKRREPQLCRLFDGVTTISDQDGIYHRETYRLDNVLGCVPAGSNPDARGLSSAVFEESTSPCIAFLGTMNWPPNADAAFWFIQEILPAIRQTVPDVRFRVIGRDPPEALKRIAAADPGIEITGKVVEVLTPLRECTVLVVPLRAGSGVRVKILESMAAGVPVVSTTVGAEGLHMRHGQELLLADDAPALSAAVLRMLQDSSLRKTLAENALHRVTQEFAWSKSAEKLRDYGAELHRRKHTA